MIDIISKSYQIPKCNYKNAKVARETLETDMVHVGKFSENISL